MDWDPELFLLTVVLLLGLFESFFLDLLVLRKGLLLALLLAPELFLPLQFLRCQLLLYLLRDPLPGQLLLRVPLEVHGVPLLYGHRAHHPVNVKGPVGIQGPREGTDEAEVDVLITHGWFV